MLEWLSLTTFWGKAIETDNPNMLHDSCVLEEPTTDLCMGHTTDYSYLASQRVCIYIPFMRIGDLFGKTYSMRVSCRRKVTG